MWHVYFRKILNERFEGWRTPRNLSLRNYAKKLAISPGALSDLVSGKRVVSLERALEIATSAEFSAEEIERMQILHRSPSGHKPEIMIPAADTKLILNPLYYLTISALEILPNPAGLVDVAELLNRPQSEIAPIVDKLVELGIFTREGEGISWVGQYASTTEDIPSTDIQNFFRQTILAAPSGLSLPVDEREYTVVTFTGNMSEMGLAKEQIRKFRDDFPISMKGNAANQIFELSIQLRPVSDRVKGKR